MQTLQDRVISNNKHSRKITYNRAKNQKLAIQIREHFKNEFAFKLPPIKKEFSRLADCNFINKETGEDFSDFRELGNAYYNLNMSNKAVYALFEQGLEKRQQMISCLYTRHRLDHVWNYRKSQLIRKRYREYLSTSLIHEKFRPMHLVLTVPHQKGVWRGKKFYGRELLSAFNLMRKNKVWKSMIHAGEYGMEISKKANSPNGLHIHLHCLVFCNKQYKLADIETFIAAQWKKLTDATQIHLEPLYIHKKNEKGRWIKDVVEVGRMYVHHKTGEIYQSTREERRKFYFDEPWYQELPPEEKLQTAVTGILEAIKYHFKNDALLTPNGDYDLPLVAEVLNNSKYLRMYSKFGAFYGETILNFNNLQEEVKIPVFEIDWSNPQEVAQMICEGEELEKLLASHPEEIDESQYQEMDPDQLTASAAIGESLVVNPFTLQPAESDTYQRVLSLPELMSYQGQYQTEQYRQIVQDSNVYFKIQSQYHISYVMMLLAKGKYSFLVKDDQERFYQFIKTLSKPRLTTISKYQLN
jgi:hypothetical protein